jgi:hypothetical protein
MMTTTGKSKKETKPVASVIFDTVDFKTQIQPILQKNCTPCHFPGGKMYDKMPFDKGETIIGHKSGILKRFKKEEEVTAIKQFIEQNK